MPKSTRIVLSLLIAIAVGLFVVAALAPGEQEPQVSLLNNPAIQAISPGQGDEALQQNRVTLDLAPGFDGELVSVGGINIPLDVQIKGAGSAAPGASTGDIEGFVDGPEIGFLPGDAETGAQNVMDHLPSGRVCVIARYWPTQFPQQRSTVQWCFEVT